MRKQNIIDYDKDHYCKVYDKEIGPDYQIIAKETAIEAALHYFETEGILESIDWEEL